MWLTPIAMPLEKRMRGYPVAGFVVKPEGIVEAIQPKQPTPEEEKAFSEARVGPIWFWHSGEQALCLPVPTPDGKVAFAGVKLKDLREAGWTADEAALACELPRVPGSGLAIGADTQSEALMAKQRAAFQQRLRGKR